ncbi:DUF4397 domain-containing protein [Pseudoflavitalea sp. G-6-1-2]|uniref:DUF4397 domain-containing protein n=1 Tax=Pseudoflavitalea sp. G-6-1-2 TaxID=2728841 RepID=UPI00146ED7F2|nr:DUF4397 domain-containing protein [Pseudoflavitalea sp. G-6-1-2]NML21055.1 DUF4397 domain-containing protein [Pseudoflavitalea sp. G-6-1-2]
MKRFASWGAGLAVIASIMTGCLKSNNTPPEPFTNIKIMQMAATAPAIDMFMNGQKFNSSALDFGIAPHGYMPFKINQYDVVYKKSGADSLVAELPKLSYDSAKAYTLLLYSKADGTAGATRISDLPPQNAGDSKAYYRFWHLAPGVGEVEVWFGDKRMESGRNLIDNVNSGAFNSFESIDASDYRIQVKKAGTNEVLAVLENISLARYTGFTIYLKGIEGVTGGNKDLAIGITRNF